MARPAISGELLLPSSVSDLHPPSYLSPHAREYWSDLVAALGPAGMLSEVDATGLAMLCENLADYWGLRRDLENLADQPLPANATRKDEESAILAKARILDVLGSMDSRIRAWLGEMLLLPSARSRAQPTRLPAPETALDLSELDADERAALRGMLEKRREQRVLQ